jgi:hypothetical protein
MGGMFGRFPAAVPTTWIMNYLQAQHTDLEHDDEVLTSTAYRTPHRDHHERWHVARRGGGWCQHLSRPCSLRGLTGCRPFGPSVLPCDWS